MKTYEIINNLTIELDKMEENYCRTEEELFDIRIPELKILDQKQMKIYYREKNHAVDMKYKELNRIRKELRNLYKKLADAIEECNVWIKTDVGFVMKYDPADKHYIPINFLPNWFGRKTEHEHEPIAIMERIGIDYPIDFEEHIYCNKCWKCLDGDPAYDQDAVEIEIDENDIPY